jgi:hypothetical protein
MIKKMNHSLEKEQYSSCEPYRDFIITYEAVVRGDKNDIY